jgi:hypothetical protein
MTPISDLCMSGVCSRIEFTWVATGALQQCTRTY